MGRETNAVRVLVVDDEPNLLETLALILRAKQYEVTTCAEVGSALERIGRERFHILLTDLNMPGDGATVIVKMREVQPRTAILVITGFMGEEDVPPTVRAAADGVLIKPVDISELLGRMQALLRTGG